MALEKRLCSWQKTMHLGKSHVGFFDIWLFKFWYKINSFNSGVLGWDAQPSISQLLKSMSFINTLVINAVLKSPQWKQDQVCLPTPRYCTVKLQWLNHHVLTIMIQFINALGSSRVGTYLWEALIRNGAIIRDGAIISA